MHGGRPIVEFTVITVVYVCCGVWYVAKVKPLANWIFRNIVKMICNLRICKGYN